jgi:P27 family predicted phage terminase small subunit
MGKKKVAPPVTRKKAAPAKQKAAPAKQKAASAKQKAAPAKQVAKKATRRKPASKPVPPKPPAPCPVDLEHPDLSGEVARRVWRELWPDLQDRLTMLSIDRRCLVLYANAWQLLSEAQATLKHEGRYFTSEKGYVMRHPAAVDEARCVAQIRQLAAELGMSPKARKGVKVRTGDGDALKAFLAAQPPG